MCVGFFFGTCCVQVCKYRPGLGEIPMAPDGEKAREEAGPFTLLLFVCSLFYVLLCLFVCLLFVSCGGARKKRKRNNAMLGSASFVARTHSRWSPTTATGTSHEEKMCAVCAVCCEGGVLCWMRVCVCEMR